MNNTQTSDPPDERQLTREVQGGNLDSFAELIERHLDHLRGYIALKLPVPHLVNEIAHETFVFAFREGDRYSIFVLSRSVSHATPVTLRLPFASLTNATLHRLTGDPRQGNSTNFLIVPTQETLTGFAQNYSFMLPPGSIYLFVFEGANTPAETNPTATISQALGQNDPATYPQVVFNVFFSQPVSGFGSNDVQLRGSAGASRVSVVETAPNNGTTFHIRGGRDDQCRIGDYRYPRRRRHRQQQLAHPRRGCDRQPARVRTAPGPGSPAGLG